MYIFPHVGGIRGGIGANTAQPHPLFVLLRPQCVYEQRDPSSNRNGEDTKLRKRVLLYTIGRLSTYKGTIIY